MEDPSRKTVWGGSEAFWGRELPQIGKMWFGSCAGRLPSLPPTAHRRELYSSPGYIVWGSAVFSCASRILQEK